MDDSHPLPVLIRRKTCRVRGPRPCSWIALPSDSSVNEHRDTWSWTVQGPGLYRGSTLRSSTSSESSDPSDLSSSSSPMNTPNLLVEYDERPDPRHRRRRKPTGPRAPPNGTNLCVRPRLGLVINTSVSEIPQLGWENSPITPSTEGNPSPHIPPFPIDSPTNFLLDWDAIFEVLGCSKVPPDKTGSW